MEEKIDEFRNELLDLMEKHKDVPPYEMGYCALYMTVNMLLGTAPNFHVAMQTMMEGIQEGIRQNKEMVNETK